MPLVTVLRKMPQLAEGTRLAIESRPVVVQCKLMKLRYLLSYGELRSSFGCRKTKDGTVKQCDSKTRFEWNEICLGTVTHWNYMSLISRTRSLQFCKATRRKVIQHGLFAAGYASSTSCTFDGECMAVSCENEGTSDRDPFSGDRRLPQTQQCA
jgi:hypothetical protein